MMKVMFMIVGVKGRIVVLGVGRLEGDTPCGSVRVTEAVTLDRALGDVERVIVGDMLGLTKSVSETVLVCVASLLPVLDVVAVWLGLTPGARLGVELCVTAGVPPGLRLAVALKESDGVGSALGVKELVLVKL